MGSGLYILRDGVPVVEPDTLTWARWYETADNRTVARDVVNGHVVSTIFLGLDHRWGDGDPILWETMVFPADPDGTVAAWGESDADRCSGDRADALAMHAKMVERAQALAPADPGTDQAQAGRA